MTTATLTLCGCGCCQASFAAGLCEIERLRATIDGRTTPPTRAEMEAHADAGGAWLVTLPAVKQVRLKRETRYTEDPREVSRLWWSEGALWVAVMDGRPCAWPVVTPAGDDAHPDE